MERRKVYTVIRVAILAVLLISNFCFAKYSGGDGSSGNPYQIANPNDLLVLAADTNDYNDCFILVNDINLADYTFTTAIIAPDNLIYDFDFQGFPFAGIFDGNNHKIFLLTIEMEFADHLGLFGQIGSDGIVKNLDIEDVNISMGYPFIGGLCGENFGVITDCYSTGTVNGNLYAGGLCGYNYGTISNCYSDGVVTGFNDTGGLCGTNDSIINNSYSNAYVICNESDGWGTGGFCGENLGTINGCYSTGQVNGYNNTGGLCGLNSGIIDNCHSIGKVNGNDITGGLSGRNEENGNITNSYSTGVVDGNEYVGGLCGLNFIHSSIVNCYSTGLVTGNQNSGGFCGANGYDSSISNCFATGSVTGNGKYTGGLCGWGGGSITNCYSTGSATGKDLTGGLCGQSGFDGTIRNCYSTGSVVGQSNTGGLCGINVGSIISSSYFLNAAGMNNGYGEPLTDEQMKQQANFIGWDFSYRDGDEAEWFMAFDGYPILPWQISPADIYTDGKNNLKDWAVFARYWMREDCAIYNYYCEFADMDFDGDVDVNDLAELMSYWLEEGIY
ncbi:MAG: GLUG motif-containing protein [Sedimentisphaerales bacterium]